MKKYLRLMLLALISMVSGSAANAQDVTWQGDESSALPTEIGSDIVLTWDEGSAVQGPSFNSTKKAVSMKSGNKLTIAGADANANVTISKVDFVFDNSSDPGLSANVGSCSTSYGDNTTTWTGEANSITFKAGGSRLIKSITITYTGGSETPVVKVPELSITNITNMNTTVALDGEGGKTLVVYYANTGNGAAKNAKLTLYVGGAENKVVEIGEIAAGASNQWKNVTYDVTKIEKGAHEVYVSLTADDVDAVNSEKTTVTFTKADPVPAFTISASAVTVPYDAESYNVVATLKETNNVAATDVKVELRKGISEVLATETVATLAAGANTQVTLTVAKESFETGEKNYNLYVNDNFLANVAVTFEEAPVVETKDLAITSISGTLNLANTTNNVRVIVENKGNVDITDAPVTLKAGETVLGTATVSAKAGQTGWCDITVASEGLTAGDLAVKAIVEFDESKTAEFEATLTVKAKPAPTATFELTAQTVEVQLPVEKIEIPVTVKNTSEVAAENLKINLWKNGVIATETIDAIAGGETKTVRFSIDALAAGEYSMQALTEDNKFGCYITLKVLEAPVEEVKDLAITEVVGTIELANESNNVRVSVKNNGTVDINNAVVTLKAGEKTLGTATVSAAAGQTGYCQVAVASEGLEAGELAVVATVEVEDDATPADNTMEATLTVNAAPVAEATFELTAQNVEVLTTDAKVKAVVNVKNTSEVKASQVEVKLLNGTDQIGESQWIYGLEAGAAQNVTFEFANFDKAGTYQIQAVAGKQSGFFDVIVKAPVAELAIESITGTINLAQTTSNVTVAVKNNGTANVQNAKATLAYGEKTLETTIAFIKAGETGYAYFQVPSEGLTAGELNVTAKVEYEEKTIEQTATLTVKAAPAAEPTFAVTAENVTVPFGAESFEIKATVKNTSEVDAQGLTVKLLKGITEVETKTLDILLAAGAETEVSFTIAATEEAPFVAGTTASYYVQVANKAQTEVTVTFAKETVAEVKDLAIEAIQGSIDLSVEQSNVSVTVKNNGNVNVQNIKVTLTYNGQTLEGAIRNILPGEQGYAYFQIPSEGITGETLAVTAAVELEGDATPEDNTKTAELTVKAVPAAEPTFSVTAADVEVPFGAESFEIKATIKNTSEVTANGLTVKLLKGIAEVETKTLNIILAAGEETEVSFTIAATEDAPFVAGTSATYYVQVENKDQAEVKVTFAKEAEAPVIDMALTQIQGASEINLQAENKVMVWYKNNGNVAVETATVELKLNGTPVETKTITNIAAEAQGYVDFVLPTDGLEAGQTANIEVNLFVDNDANLDDNRLEKNLNIVSGEVAPAPVIAMNPISGWTVDEAGEQTISVSVGLFNNGNADAENVQVVLYKEFGTPLAEKTVSIAQGESAFVSLSFDYDLQSATTFHVAVYYNNVLATDVQDFTVSIKQQVPELSLAKIADIEATTEDEVKILAVVKNNSAIDASEVKVGVYTQGEDYQYQLVGMLRTINAIAAGESAEVEFNLGKLEAGTHKYYVRVLNTDDNMDNNIQDVTVKVTEYVASVVNVALTAIQGISNIDLAAEANTISVWVDNNGNVDVDAATVAVKLNETELEAQTVSVKAGNNAYASFTLPTEGLTAGEKAVVEVTLTVADNTAEDVTMTREYDVIDSSVATEPTYSVTAENVTVPFGVESFEIKAIVKNTSAINAENVEVKLFRNEVIATQNIESLAAGDEAEVSFTVTEIGEAGKIATYYVQAPKAQAVVDVTFEEEVVAPVYDLAIVEVLGTIKLAEENNYVRVTVQNNGNQDIADAAVELKAGENVLGTSVVSAKAGNQGWCQVAVATDGLEAGELAVVATVTVENDATPADNTMEATLTVEAAPVAEATFEVAADDVTVAYGATSFEIKAVVKNTSEVDAQGLTVTLLKGITKVETKTLDLLLKAGEETTVTFTVNATEEAPFVAGTTATYFVQVENKVQTEVTVIFEQPEVEPVVDMAVTAINGRLSAEVETNYLTVFVENKGNVDVKDATVTLTAAGVELGTATVSAKAGGNGFCSVAVPASAITGEQFTVTATVAVEGDADLTNNTLEKTFTIEQPAPEVALTIADVIVTPGRTEFYIPVKVKNLRENFAAKNVKVMIYDSSKLIGQTTIATIAAGDEVSALVTVKLESAYTQDQVLRAWATGFSETETVEFKLLIDTDNSVTSIKYWQNQNAKIYTIGGKKVERITKPGLYIINGRRVVVK